MYVYKNKEIHVIRLFSCCCYFFYFQMQSYSSIDAFVSFFPFFFLSPTKNRFESWFLLSFCPFCSTFFLVVWCMWVRVDRFKYNFLVYRFFDRGQKRILGKIFFGMIFLNDHPPSISTLVKFSEIQKGWSPKKTTTTPLYFFCPLLKKDVQAHPRKFYSNRSTLMWAQT